MRIVSVTRVARDIPNPTLVGLLSVIKSSTTVLFASLRALSANHFTLFHPVPKWEFHPREGMISQLHTYTPYLLQTVNRKSSWQLARVLVSSARMTYPPSPDCTPTSYTLTHKHTFRQLNSRPVQCTAGNMIDGNGSLFPTNKQKRNEKKK